MPWKSYQNKRLLNVKESASKAILESNINYRLLIDMGIKFKVLIQDKNVSRYPLSGLNKI